MLSSYTTTPIARRILLDIIGELNIKKQKGEIEKELEWNDKEYVIVPNVIGMKLDEAKKQLNNFEIITEGVGDTITYQSISANEKVEIGSKIRLFLK